MCGISLMASAQATFDVLKMSETELSGSSRYMSMAGAFGALGGDASAVTINPGGIGVFRSSDISKQAGSSRLHFAEPEYMERFLDTTPGSASVMGLINDRENTVQLLVDHDVISADYVGCHPCINTSSLCISSEDVFGRFLEAVHHEYIVVHA